MRITRTRPFPYLFLISGTSNLQFNRQFFGTPVARSDPILEQRSCHGARSWGTRSLGDKLLARALYRLERARRPATWGKSMTTATEIHPVDQILPTPRLLALGLQHVLVMYAGAVAV